jgi:hypothetical protein
MAILAMCMIVKSCGSADDLQFGKRRDKGDNGETSDNRGSQDATPSSQRNNFQDAKNKEGNSMDNTGMANEPVMTGGAFLSCGVESSDGKAKTATLGCGIYHKNQKVPLPSGHTYSVQRIRPDGAIENMMAETMATDNRWHWTFSLSVDKADKDMIRATIFYKAKEYVYEQSMKEILDKPKRGDGGPGPGPGPGKEITPFNP